MKNIHILPTNKPSRLWTNNLRRRLELDEFPEQHPTNIAKHIYITSDEEIKEGDWKYNEKLNCISQHLREGKAFPNEFKKAAFWCKKIILTTDQDLIKDSVQAIDDEFLEWFVKNPSCENVEIGNDYEEPLGDCYKIITPKEEPKQETLKEAAENESEYLADWEDKDMYQKGFIEGAKWQQERMYSEKQMDDAYDKGFKDAKERMYSEEEVFRIIASLLHTPKLVEELSWEDIAKWFEQFKQFKKK